MIPFSAAMKQAVSGDVTTLCYGWKLTRKDGLVFGFTDHDRTLIVDGVTCKPNSGFTAKEAETTLGLTIGNSEIEGALDDAEITANDLSAGLYDGAAVSLYLVNWQNPAEFALLRTAYIARIEQSDGVWRAELEGDAASFSIKRGRIFRKNCDAEVGDARCGVALSSSAFLASGIVGAVYSSTEFEVFGVNHFGQGWFTGGALKWTSGLDSNANAQVSSQKISGDKVVMTLRQAPLIPVVTGVTFTVKAGCDRSFDTCKRKFNNSLNFQGFPHMPGNDQAYAYARDGMNFDGGPSVL